MQLLTHGGVAVGIQGDGPLAMHVARPSGRVRGLDVDAVMDPKADQVLNIGPIDGGAVVLSLPKGTTQDLRRLVNLPSRTATHMMR